MARTKKEQPKKATARAGWRGHLRFGLVSFAVQGFNARVRENGRILFHQLHGKCHSRIRYEKHCPLHGKVSNDEIVTGYEYAKNRYVELDPDEVDQLRTERERSLTIDGFIDPGELDPIYFDGRMYYLAPDGASAREPYSVFVEALRRGGRFGVGQAVFSSREHVVLVRPYEKVLVMQMLTYAAEIRPPQRVVDDLALPRNASREVAMAQKLIDNWTEKDFDIARYVDPYDEKVKTLVDAKVKGREIVAPEADEEPEVINLMDALKKSISRGQKKKTESASNNHHGRRPAASRRQRAS